MSERPLFTVCIPAYNRSSLLHPLLESIEGGAAGVSCEILVAEDGSPERAAIAQVVTDFSKHASVPVRYVENGVNLGYDGNLRSMIEAAEGRYCVFFGNDDLAAPGAMGVLQDIVERVPSVGVVVRSYAAYSEKNGVGELFRYSPTELVLPPGSASAAYAFRRCVVISGLCFDRDLAASFATDRLDGTLLYQLYACARVALRRQVVVTPEILAHYRVGGVPDFGTSAREKGKFTPGEQTVPSSEQFMRGMVETLKISAEDREIVDPIVFQETVLRDLSNYSYPFLAMHRAKGLRIFAPYVLSLRRVGVVRTPIAYAYVIGLFVLGRRPLDLAIRAIKRRRGAAPELGIKPTTQA